MDKVIIEVGSTCTKVDLFDGGEINRIKTETIEFKKHYKQENKLDSSDVGRLINLITELKKQYKDIYVCGTSIFRSLPAEQKEAFLDLFQNKTGIKFDIVSQEKENELTVEGAAKKLNRKVAVLVGGGGSTEISIYENGITEMVNTPIGVIDIINQYPDLVNDYATTNVEEVKRAVKEKLNLPKQKADTLILAGGGHLRFALNSGISYEKNNLYNDKMQPIMMDIETRKKDTERYYKEISLDNIRNKVEDPNWWDATRAMCAFVLVIAEEIGAKNIVPTDISMVHGLLNK